MSSSKKGDGDAKNAEETEGRVAGDAPSNIYLLNVAFYSFFLFAVGQMFVATLIAKSAAMLGDSAAMLIDSLTYLFNSWAERSKNISLEEIDNSSLTDREKELRRMGRTRHRLWLEILPPLFSVTFLIFLTIYIMLDGIKTLSFDTSDDDDGSSKNTEDEPNIGVMFFFSTLNLGLDILNVTCFARARHAFGFAVIDQDRHRYSLVHDGSLHNVYADSMRVQSEVDLSGLDQNGDNVSGEDYCTISNGANGSSPIQNEEATSPEVNLNMCSAYTHVFADTLRSTAVLIAAGLAYTCNFGAPAVVDAIAALAVSFIILVSLGPLLRGIFHAWAQMKHLSNIESRMTNGDISELSPLV